MDGSKARTPIVRGAEDLELISRGRGQSRL